MGKRETEGGIGDGLWVMGWGAEGEGRKAEGENLRRERSEAGGRSGTDDGSKVGTSRRVCVKGARRGDDIESVSRFFQDNIRHTIPIHASALSTQ